MRKNLITMLNECSLSKALGLTDCSFLFSDSRQLLHTTSLIKYPVFYKAKNYTGHQPPIQKSNLLCQYAYHVFPQELSMIQRNALIIPLGSMVEETLKTLNQNSAIHQTFLTGFPHSSGANGHRIRQFQEQKEQLRKQIENWAWESKRK